MKRSRKGSFHPQFVCHTQFQDINYITIFEVQLSGLLAYILYYSAKPNIKYMAKHLLLSLALGATFVSQVAVTAMAAEAPTLFGVWRNVEAGARPGIFTFKAEPDAQPEFVYGNGELRPTGSAAYTDNGQLYILNYLEFYEEYYWSMMTYNFTSRNFEEDWKNNYRQLDDMDLYRDVSGDTTYDPTSDLIYCIGLKGKGLGIYSLKIMDRETGRKTWVADFPQRVHAIACTAKGQLYGISTDGYLCRIDKHTGELDPVGFTGLIPDKDSAAVIDYETNTMYWSAYTEANGGELYSVDLSNGKAMFLSRYDNNYQFANLFIEQTAHTATAPQVVKDLVPTFEGASLSGTVNFTLPSLDTNGNPLSGTVNYAVSVDGKEVAKGSGEPGEAVAPAVTVEKAGIVRFVVNVDCYGEAGPAVSDERWIGMDTPQAVTDLLVTVDGNEFTVSWNLPERGINGGFVDHSLVRYQIYRGPENVCVASAHEGTTFTETVVRDGVYPVMYFVTPIVEGLEGEGVLGNTILLGDHVDAPVAFDMSDPYLCMGFESVDSNNDLCTWEWNVLHGYMACWWPMSTDRLRDDWLYTPAIRLEADCDYIVKINLAAEGQWVVEKEDFEDFFAGELAVYLDSADETENFHNELLAKEEVTKCKWYDRVSDSFRFNKETFVKVGLHSTGGIEEGNVYKILVSKIEVAKADNSGVAEVIGGDFSALGLDGGLRISNPAGASVKVFTLDGRLAAQTSAIDAYVSLPAGLYIVTDGAKTLKLAVR